MHHGLFPFAFLPMSSFWRGSKKVLVGCFSLCCSGFTNRARPIGVERKPIYHVRTIACQEQCGCSDVHWVADFSIMRNRAGYCLISLFFIAACFGSYWYLCILGKCVARMLKRDPQTPCTGHLHNSRLCCRISCHARRCYSGNN